MDRRYKCCCKKQTEVHCGECEPCVRGDGCGYGPEGNVIGMSRQPVASGFEAERKVP